MAADRLEGLTGGIGGVSFEVAGDDGDVTLMFEANLRGAEDVAGGMQGEADAVDFFSGPIRHRFDLSVVTQPAAENGAAAVMAERVPPVPLPERVPFIKVLNVRRALAFAAAKFYPRQPRVIAAVTGTSGKTSVVSFTRQLWTSLGERAASIGTVGLVTPTREAPGSLTTPDPVALHRSLDALAGEGVTHLAMEASSHGLDQHRASSVVPGGATAARAQQQSCGKDRG